MMEVVDLTIESSLSEGEGNDDTISTVKPVKRGKSTVALNNRYVCKDLKVNCEIVLYSCWFSSSEGEDNDDAISTERPVKRAKSTNSRYVYKDLKSSVRYYCYSFVACVCVCCHSWLLLLHCIWNHCNVVGSCLVLGGHCTLIIRTQFLWRKLYSYGVTPKTGGHHACFYISTYMHARVVYYIPACVYLFMYIL